MYMDEGGCSETAAMEGISILGHENFHFGYDTLVMVMGDLNLGHTHLKNYHPDIVELFEIALQALVEAYFTYNKLPYERIHFRKSLPTYVVQNCETLYNNLVNLYYVACLYKVLENYRDEYYYNFSWFYDIEKKEELKPEIPTVPAEEIPKEHSDNVYDELNARYESERKRIIEISRRYSHELAEKDRVIDARDVEIATLKQQLQIQQEFVDLFHAEEETEIADTVDINSLYEKRFLFVGKLYESYSELKKNFPNSVFMESETANLKSLKVDGVVLLIRNMSHSMYYKVMQSNQLADLPLIYCNSRNINNVYQAILHGMQE